MAQAQAGTTRAVLELEVNGVRHGDVIVLLQGNDVFVPKNALSEAGIIKLSSRELRDGLVDYVSLATSSPHLTYQVNELDLVLEVVAPPSALRSATLDLSEPAPPGLWYSEEPSAYLTYAPSLIDGERFRAFGEGGFSYGSLRLTNSESYEGGQRPKRLMSQLVWSDRANVREFVLGDSYASSGPLGGSALIGGFSVARNFALDPYFVHIPRLGYRGSVMAPSTVDVYVNNVLVRRVAVAPGEFDLRGIAPSSGAGNVRYVIRDPLSRQSDVVTDYYSASSALAPGLSEYSYTAGFARRSYGTADFDYGRPLILGRYRLGVTSGLTTGVRADIGQSRISAGSQITLSGGWGEAELGSAFSIDGEHRVLRGTAGLLGYYYQRGPVSVRAVVKGTSPHYSTASLGPLVDRNLLETSTSTGLALGTKTSISTQLGFARDRDFGERALVSVSLGRQLSRSIFIQALGSRSDGQGRASRYDVFATLNVALPADHGASLSGYTDGEHSEATASLSRPIMGRTGLGYQGSATFAERKRASVSAQVQTSFLRADASYFDDGSGPHSLIDASGTILWLKDAGVFVSRPVSESFAVVEVPHTEGVTVLLNNQPIGKTSAAGRVLVPDLQAYYGNRLRVDGGDLPHDVELDDGDVMVAPPPHGGARVVFNSRRLRAVRGKLLPDGLAIEAIRHGELLLRAAGGRFTSPIGHLGEFELEGVPNGEWRGEARGEAAYCTFTLTVPEAGKAIQEVGEVRCFSEGAVR